MNPKVPNIFIFAGEPSGDLHGSHLVKRLMQISPEIRISGVAGPNMRKEGVKGQLRMEDFEVMGLSDVLKSLPKLIRHFYCVRNTILKQAPDAVVLIDYPGFNLRLAKALKQKGFKGKIIQYVSPSVWAWGKHRIQEMERSLDLLLTIYPFEAACFAQSPLPIEYVGSPIQEYMRKYPYKDQWKQEFKIPHSASLVALFPGSRQGEVIRNLPLLLEAAIKLKNAHPDLVFGLSCFNQATIEFLKEKRGHLSSLKDCLYPIPKEYTYELMRDSRCAIAKSGTSTLELALHQCPTVAVYQLSYLNRLYAQYFLKVNLPHYCIVNILAQQEVFPELIAHGCDADTIFLRANGLVQEGITRQTCLKACQEITSSLGDTRASEQAANAILKVLPC